MVVACGVCHWSAANKTAVVQITNPSDQYLCLTRDTLLGHIAQVSVAPNHTISAVQTDSKKTESTRNELRTALAKALDQTTLIRGECTLVLVWLTKYRSGFSQSPQELGRCTPTEAELALEPGTRPVNRAPYRAYPCVQETIDKREPNGVPGAPQ